jgi:hypothetical protein
LRHVTWIVAVATVLILTACLFILWRTGNWCSARAENTYYTKRLIAADWSKVGYGGTYDSNIAVSQTGTDLLAGNVTAADPNARRTPHSENNGNDEPPNWWEGFVCEIKATDVAVAVFTFFLVLVGGIQAFFLWRSSVDTSKTAAAALANTDALRTQLRASVSGEVVGMQFIPRDETVRVSVDLINSGQTPAYRCRSMWEIEVRKHPLSEEVRVDSEKLALTPPAVIYPQKPRGSEREYSIGSRLADIYEREHALYVTGFVTYEDAFGDIQGGEFNYFLDKAEYQRWRILARQHPDKAVPARWQISSFNNVALPPRGKT